MIMWSGTLLRYTFVGQAAERRLGCQRKNKELHVCLITLNKQTEDYFLLNYTIVWL